MKARIVFIFILITITGISFSQKLAVLYKKDMIQLEPLDEFAQGNNWPELFKDYNTVGYGRNLGQQKKIVIAPDGSIFMSHKTVHEIWKFDNKGKLVKKFGSQGSKPGQFLYLPSVLGILDGKYLITDDVQGRLNLFDLDGNFVKMIKLDYMPLETTLLKDGKIAIMGFVAWKGSQSRQFIRIIDINSDQFKEIWQETIPYNKDKRIIYIEFPGGGAMGCLAPFQEPWVLRFKLTTSREGHLIVASPVTSEIKEYGTDGNLINTFKLNINPLKITEKDIKDQYNQAKLKINEFEKNIVESNKHKWSDADKKSIIESYKNQVENYKDPKFYPEHLPYFSSIIIDSDGNLLVFEFTKEEDKAGNKFLAYSYDLKGNLLGTSSFKCDKLNLSFTAGTFQFYNGFVYVVTSNPDGPPQIAKLKLL